MGQKNFLQVAGVLAVLNFVWAGLRHSNWKSALTTCVLQWLTLGLVAVGLSKGLLTEPVVPPVASLAHVAPKEPVHTVHKSKHRLYTAKAKPGSHEEAPPGTDPGEGQEDGHPQGRVASDMGGRQ